MQDERSLAAGAAVVPDQALEFLELGTAAGEVGDVGRQLSRDRRCRLQGAAGPGGAGPVGVPLGQRGRHGREREHGHSGPGESFVAGEPSWQGASGRDVGGDADGDCQQYADDREDDT
ncbi:hypothetical protein ACFQY4_18285 [Catellatospora bangladeshensis]|uniref:hypothetical protein n=1 Tax=Catellatospora bangladeshensis TaxID=310355 RepID=UPI0036189C2B